MRCRRPGSSIGGRLLASRRMAAASATWVTWSGSNCTVTLAAPATACRTSRRFFRAEASAIERVLTAVSSRVPSSARSAVSPSGWMRTLTVERCGGMCAHKDGVEDAGHDFDAQQPGAREPDGPPRDDGRRRYVPGHEVAALVAGGSGEVEEIRRLAAGGKGSDRVRQHEQRDEPPGEGQSEQREDVRVELGQGRIAGRPNPGAQQQRGERIPGERKGSHRQGDSEGSPNPVGQQTPRQPPRRRSLRRVLLRRPRGGDRVSQPDDEEKGQQGRDHDAGRQGGSPPAAKGPGERLGDEPHAATIAAVPIGPGPGKKQYSGVLVTKGVELHAQKEESMRIRLKERK